MPRPISWLPFVRDLHRSVSNSVRSHYSRRDLEILFRVQRRSAQRILDLMPRQLVGATIMAGKEDLAAFLSRVREADDVPKLLHQIRTQEKPGVIRQKPRQLYTHDWSPAGLDSLPDAITLRRGRLEVNFRNQVQLAEAMLWIAKVIETDEFARAYCFAELVKKPPASVDVELQPRLEAAS